MVLFSVLRPRHWLKNLLVFVVPIAASAFDRQTLLSASLAFVALSFAASGSYALNDLLDRESDRKHPTKQSRAIAAGKVGIRAALGIATFMLLGSLAVAQVINPRLLGLVVIYVVATLAYSILLKSLPAVDIVLLAGFFVLRVFAGALATGLGASNWLLATSFFAFLSLAAAKRVVEMSTVGSSLTGPINRRGYRPEDREVVTAVGVSSGLGAGILLCLYIESASVFGFSSLSGLLWMIPVLWVYWLIRLWLIVSRGRLDHDPIDFVLRDRVTYALGGLVVLFLLLGRAGG